HSNADVTFTSSNAQHPGGAHSESYDFHHFGGSVGLGVRLMPKLQTVRPTLGIGGGVSFRAAVYHRDASNVAGSNSYASDPATYVAPMMVLDGGVLFGGTPGTRFYLGARLLMEFPGGATASGSDQSSGP